MSHEKSLFLFFLFINGVCLFSETENIILTTGKDPESAAYVYLEKVYSEAFSRLGMNLELTGNSLSRSTRLSDAGDVDGEISRIYDYGRAHPTLVRVEQPHWAVRFIAITNNPDIALDGWKSLNDTSYKVCFHRGAMIYQQQLSPYVEEVNRIPVDFGCYGLEMILSGRADIFVVSEADGREMLQRKEYENTGLFIAGVMGTYTSHAYIHERHGDLAHNLFQALEEMMDEGLLLRYKEETGGFIYDGFFDQHPSLSE